jgi:hypothetical protein
MSQNMRSLWSGLLPSLIETWWALDMKQTGKNLQFAMKSSWTISHVNTELISSASDCLCLSSAVNAMRETVSEMSDTNFTLTQLITWKYFTGYIHCENYKLHALLVTYSFYTLSAMKAGCIINIIYSLQNCYAECIISGTWTSNPDMLYPSRKVSTVVGLTTNLS